MSYCLFMQHLYLERALKFDLWREIWPIVHRFRYIHKIAKIDY